MISSHSNYIGVHQNSGIAVILTRGSVWINGSWISLWVHGIDRAVHFDSQPICSSAHLLPDAVKQALHYLLEARIHLWALQNAFHQPAQGEGAQVPHLVNGHPDIKACWPLRSQQLHTLCHNCQHQAQGLLQLKLGDVFVEV